MADESFDPEAYLNAASAFVGVPVAAEYRSGVVENLRLLHRMASLVTSFPLDDAVEAAPVFEP
jgi:hypothetical protein